MTVRNPLMEIRGGEQRLVDPLESLVKDTYLQIELAERNRVGVSFVELVERSEEIGERYARRKEVKRRPVSVSEREQARIVKRFLEGEMGEEGIPIRELDSAMDGTFTIFRPWAQRLGKNEIAVYREGKREIWEVDPQLYNAFMSGDAVQANILSKIMQVPAKTLRAGSVLTPEFIARNIFRDSLSAFVFSDAGFKPLVDSWSGLWSLARKDAEYQAWLRSGGPMAELVSIDRQYLQKGIREMLEITNWRDTTRNTIRSPLEALRVISTFSEQVTRVGEFKKMRQKALKEGKTEEEALFEAGLASREVTLDFGRSGAQGQVLNRYVAFFNAQMQGVDRIVRAFKDHPVRTSARVFGAITVPSIILQLMNRDEEGWSEIPQWQKDLFWLVPIKSPWDIPGLTIEKGGNIWMRLPKPFELGILFGTVPERIIEYILSEDPKAFDELKDTIIRGSTPSIVPTAVVPFLETVFNYNIFLDRPIIPQHREGMLPETQYSPYTTELTKAIGRSIADIPGMRRSRLASPAILDNLIRAWTGGLGNHLLRLADMGLRESGVLPHRVDPTLSLADIPLVKAFFVRFPTASAESIQRFYKMYDEEEQLLATFEGLVRAGEIEAANAQREAQQGILASPREIRETLAGMSWLVRQLYYNQQIGREEKTQAIHNLYYQMIEISKMGIEVLENIKEMRGELHRERKPAVQRKRGAFRLPVTKRPESQLEIAP
jgi:hypothetical protein